MLSSVAKFFFFNKSTLLIQSKTQCIRYQRSPVSLVQPQSLFNRVREENSLVITPKMRWPSQQLRRWRTFISHACHCLVLYSVSLIYTHLL